MAALQGAFMLPHAVSLPGHRPPRKLPPRTRARAAVALWTTGALVAGGALAGCEYTYDDGWRPGQDATAAPPATQAAPSPEWWRDDPVDEAHLEDWLQESQMGGGPEVVHRGFGLLQALEIHNGATAVLPEGTYVLALACRSQRRVNFTVRNAEATLVNLSLRCGSRRENVIYLADESALTFRVEASSAANFAYRIIRS